MNDFIRLAALLLVSSPACGGSDTPSVSGGALDAGRETATTAPANDGGDGGDDGASGDATDSGYSPTSCPLTSGHPKCPPAYVCSCPPIGSSVPVCAGAGALSPPPCNQTSDCQDIPGSTCMAAQNGGIYCTLPCSP